jgi:GTP cyclohydrolase I
MSYNKTKTDPELGKEIHNYLVLKGVETPTVPINMDRKDKIAEIEKSFKYIMQVMGLNLDDDSLMETPKRVAKMYVNEISKRFSRGMSTPAIRAIYIRFLR